MSRAPRQTFGLRHIKEARDTSRVKKLASALDRVNSHYIMADSEIGDGARSAGS